MVGQRIGIRRALPSETLLPPAMVHAVEAKTGQPRRSTEPPGIPNAVADSGEQRPEELTDDPIDLREVRRVVER